MGMHFEALCAIFIGTRRSVQTRLLALVAFGLVLQHADPVVRRVNLVSTSDITLRCGLDQL